MKLTHLDYWKYQLTPRNSLNRFESSNSREVGSHHSRKGALLRITWADGVCGFGDLHSWSNFADPPLKEQLQMLSSSRSSQPAFSHQIFQMAYVDGVSRRDGTHLIQSNNSITNHYLLTDFLNIKADVFSQLIETHENFIRDHGSLEHQTAIFKIKMGRDAVNEANRINQLVANCESQRFKLRLDFNACFTSSAFLEWLSLLSEESLGRVEFFEDPTTYCPRLWTQIKAKHDVKLARDFIQPGESPQSEGIDVIVLKPVRQRLEDYSSIILEAKIDFVVTHYMDHSLGQMWALYQAQQIKSKLGRGLLSCGLLRDKIYQADKFSQQVQETAHLLAAPKGIGLGFGELLEDLPWTKIY